MLEYEKYYRSNNDIVSITEISVIKLTLRCSSSKPVSFSRLDFLSALHQIHQHTRLHDTDCGTCLSLTARNSHKKKNIEKNNTNSYCNKYHKSITNNDGMMTFSRLQILFSIWSDKYIEIYGLRYSIVW